MILGVAEDFTSNVVLDTQLKEKPTGLFLNSGVHPCITIDNLLHFLPFVSMDIEEWRNNVNYDVFEITRNKKDLVSSSDKIYQSIKKGINQPLTNTEYWLETNIESLRLKTLIYQVIDKVKVDLNLEKQLVSNQYLYEVGHREVELPSDFSAWVFESKGSDYIKFRINQISIQAKSVTPLNLYVINENKLVDTLQITPKNGELSFEEVNYEFSGKGKWIFAIDSQTVLVGNEYIDPLIHEGFTVHTATGTGNSADSANYAHTNTGNGLGFNITVYSDGLLYLQNTISELSSFVRSVFEYVCFQTFLHNPNNRSNRNERLRISDEMLIAELKDLKADTVVRKYREELKKAKKLIDNTIDTHINNESDFEIEFDVI